MIITVPKPIERSDQRPFPIPKYDGMKMSLEDFLNWEAEADGFKYEWNNGVIEADESMKLPEVKLYKNIARQFSQTKEYRAGTELVCEVECNFIAIKRVRRPDICLLKKEQIDNPGDQKSNIPEFVVEIISATNSSWEVEAKMHDYFNAGVKMVWHIYPELKEVRIYYSAKSVKICTESDRCDMGDVVPDFGITVDELFG